MIKMQFWRRIELGLWGAIPCAVTLLLLIIYLAPKHIAGISHFMPALPLIPVFYWGLYYPQAMPFWFVFLLGLLLDAVTGTPLGMSSLLYVFFLAILHAQSKYIMKEGFVVQLGYFGLLLASTMAFNWLLLLFINGQASGILAAFIQWVLTLCCYPIFYRIFDGLAHYTGTRRRRIHHGR